MIQNANELALTRAQLRRVEAALDDLREDVKPKNERLYHAMAESYIDLILDLRADIDAYLGITPRVVPTAPPHPVSEPAHAG